MTSPEQIVLRFNDCINRRDLNGLEKLMTNDHAFIDSANNIDSGKQKCLDNWRKFFELFPDYNNIFGKIFHRDNLIIMTGYSVCSDKRLDGPTIWTAKITDDKVAEWRVYEDTAENRKQLEIDV